MPEEAPVISTVLPFTEPDSEPASSPPRSGNPLTEGLQRPHTVDRQVRQIGRHRYRLPLTCLAWRTDSGTALSSDRPAAEHIGRRRGRPSGSRCNARVLSRPASEPPVEQLNRALQLGEGRLLHAGDTEPAVQPGVDLAMAVPSRRPSSQTSRCRSSRSCARRSKAGTESAAFVIGSGAGSGVEPPGGRRRGHGRGGRWRRRRAAEERHLRGHVGAQGLEVGRRAGARSPARCAGSSRARGSSSPGRRRARRTSCSIVAA